MSVTCSPAAQQVTTKLGFDCHHVSTVVGFRAPWHLANWTLPVLELVIVAGALFALWHAIRRYRAGDSVNLALWFASLVYLFVTEPPLYFPEWFGLDKQYGFIFAHNQFSVQFMWGRLPLYIVAFYTVITQLTYEVARSLGFFRDRRFLSGAVAVAFISQVFYEIFDQIGPQLRWWAWNPDNKMVNHPMFASVPMTSMLLFASVSMGAMAWLVARLCGASADRSQRRGLSLTWRVVVAGALTPLTMAIAGIPSSIFGGKHPNITAEARVLGVELALVWIVGALVVIGRLRELPSTEELSAFVRFYPMVYLAAMTLFWVTALPDYFDAFNGVTPDGTPTGSAPYALACFIAADLLLIAPFRSRRPARAPRPAAADIRTHDRVR